MGSQSQSQGSSQRSSQSQRRSRSQTQNQEEEVEVKLVEHNARVMEMYKWLCESGSWTTIKKTLQKWVKEESDVDDGESYADLTLDVVNLMLYCGGIRTFK